MTLTERAWELVVASITVTGDDTTVLAPENAFIVAKRFEEESAKHEAPKTEGEVFYAVAWESSDGYLVFHDGSNDRLEIERQLSDLADDKDDAKYFLVEVRRVK